MHLVPWEIAGDFCQYLEVQKVGCELCRQEKKILNDMKKKYHP